VREPWQRRLERSVLRARAAILQQRDVLKRPSLHSPPAVHRGFTWGVLLGSCSAPVSAAIDRSWSSRPAQREMGRKKINITVEL
jgi:hypothetical protein